MHQCGSLKKGVSGHSHGRLKDSQAEHKDIMLLYLNFLSDIMVWIVSRYVIIGFQGNSCSRVDRIVQGEI